jgi:hypothetical protein
MDTNPKQHTTSTTQAQAENVIVATPAPKTRVDEYLLLAFGLFAVLSIFIGNGFLLSILCIFFLLVGLGSIISSMARSKLTVNNIRQNVINPAEDGAKVVYVKEKQPMSTTKLLTLTILVLLFLPFIGPVLFFLFVLLMLAVGGGQSS